MRNYVPYPEKHKFPKGFGSRCPRQMPLSSVQALLDKAIQVDGLGPKKLWNSDGRWCFCAHPSPHAGANAWHGFPVIGGHVDERVLRALVREGRINEHQRRHLRAQRALPEEWP